MKRAIVLCSGGIDSVTTAYYIKRKLRYKKIAIVFFDYGQKALNIEKKYAKNCAKMVEGEFIEIDLKWLGEISNSLINKKGKISEIGKKDLKDTKKESEKFYVPCRNTLFLSYALSLAESRFIEKKEVSDIFVGFKCEGKESYPDTTKEFVSEMNKISKISCSYPYKIIAPLINKDKEDIILLGKKLGINFKETISCYSPIKSKQCGFCLACQLRKSGFYWAGIKDATEYRS